MEIMVAPGKNKNVDILEFEDAARGTLKPSWRAHSDPGSRSVNIRREGKIWTVKKWRKPLSLILKFGEGQLDVRTRVL